jgi:hypothetical protein
MTGDALQLVVSSLGGGIIGSFIIYFLGRRTDRENRKRDFRSFIAGWRAEIVQCGPSLTANQFTARLPIFEREVERVRADYDARFQELAGNVSCFTAGKVEGEFDNFQAAIKAIEEFAKKD